ncbi:MAG: PQQ-binding-like beta-propeller repeat protein, partial [Verrucomicrobiota bacterium]
MKAIVLAGMIGMAGAFLSVGPIAASPGDVIWEFPVEGKVIASPALDRDGTAYFGIQTGVEAEDRPSSFYAVHADGTLKWRTGLPDWVRATAALADGRVYVPCFDTGLYCLDQATGEILWRSDTAGVLESSPAVDSLGRIYFGSEDRLFRAIDPEGELLWWVLLDGGIFSSPLIDEVSGRLYVADKSNTIHAIDFSGNLRWSYRPRQGSIEGRRLRFLSSPALGTDGRLFIGSGDRYVYCLDAEEGTLLWRHLTEGLVDSSPVLGRDGRVIVANRAGECLALASDVVESSARVLWAANVGQVFYASPTLDRNGDVYMCGFPPTEPGAIPRSRLACLSGGTGEEIWSVMIDGFNDSSPTLDREGHLVLGTTANRLWKIEGNGRMVEDTSWPMFGGTSERVGRFEITYSQWSRQNGLPAGSSLQDPDKDGISNVVEFAIGTGPLAADLRLTNPFQTIRLVNGRPQLIFRSAKGVRVEGTIEETEDFRHWNPFRRHPSETRFQDWQTFWLIG